MIQLPSQPIATKTKLAFAMSIILATALGLTACEKQPDNTAEEATEQTSDANTTDSNASDTGASDENTSEALSPNDSSSMTETSNAEMVSTRDKEFSIDWDKVDSGVEPIDRKDFNYPFKQDSDSVKSQAEFSGITNEQAQHSLTVGMASNEPLEAIIDQLGDSYLSHTFSEKDATLHVYTTPNVAPSRFDYVIAHEFAKGLVLSIEVQPRSESDVDAKSDNTSAPE